jgi:hypothetical protein
LLVALAFLAGAPALLYEVVWTRQVSLLVGSQVEAISAVLVGFFGGLALGTWAFGRIAVRARRPLRLFALLEAGAALLAVAVTCSACRVAAFRCWAASPGRRSDGFGWLRALAQPESASAGDVA